MNFIETAWKVKPILEAIPESRDSDRFLIAEVWRREISSFPEGLDKNDVLGLLQYGMIENPETITRIRRKLQETNESLRGAKYESRHRIEADTCRQLSFFNIWNY